MNKKPQSQCGPRSFLLNSVYSWHSVDDVEMLIDSSLLIHCSWQLNKLIEPVQYWLVVITSNAKRCHDGYSIQKNFALSKVFFVPKKFYEFWIFSRVYFFQTSDLVNPLNLWSRSSSKEIFFSEEFFFLFLKWEGQRKRMREASGWVSRLK